MSLEDKYQNIFFEYTRKLDLLHLGTICHKFNVDPFVFIEWLKADKVRFAKMEEVFHTRITYMENVK